MNKQQSAYMESLDLHIRSVQEAGAKIGVEPLQLAVHDQSKFTDIEFVPYAEYFYNKDGTRAIIKNKNRTDSYTRAWLHHLHNNMHHWQYWIFPDNWEPDGADIIKGVMRMPDNYALEMIADWMGASKAYTDSWDMTKWLKEHIPHIVVHPKTSKYLKSELSKIGYEGLMGLVEFKKPE